MSARAGAADTLAAMDLPTKAQQRVVVRPLAGDEPRVVVRPLAGDEPQVESFIAAHPDATLFHRLPWRGAILETLGHDCPYLVSERGGRISGVLPLVDIRSRIVGRRLVSTGFTVGGGVLADDGESHEALIEAAESLASRHRCTCLELRAAPPDRPGWIAATGLYAGFEKRLSGDLERAIPRKRRAAMRRARARGLRVRCDHDSARFFEVYAASLHRLGTPVLPQRFFRALETAFGLDCEVMTVEADGIAMASVMTFYHRGVAMPYYGGCLPRARGENASELLYGVLMQRAAGERGCHSFDFGRSRQGTGAFAFKRHWGFEPRPLVYGFWLPEGGRLPDLNPASPRWHAAVALWQRLPLAVATAIGPPIARRLG